MATLSLQEIQPLPKEGGQLDERPTQALHTIQEEAGLFMKTSLGGERGVMAPEVASQWFSLLEGVFTSLFSWPRGFC